jgi:hypothetical protein
MIGSVGQTQRIPPERSFYRGVYLLSGQAAHDNSSMDPTQASSDTDEL